jgi:hypothetical protein
VAEEAVCWLCGSGYRASVTECGDCRLPLLRPDARVGPTPDQIRIRALADAHLSGKERDRVRPALASLPDVLVEGEHVLFLSDARHRRRRGVLVVTSQALCWVPVDEEAEAGAIEFGAIEQVEAWPGDGGQIRVTTADDIHVFSEVGSRIWIDQFASVLDTARRSPAEALVAAERYDTIAD